MQTIEGIYRNGQIELTEQPADIADNTRVLITFLRPRTVDLSAYGIDPIQAAVLRVQLQPFASDWEEPEMDIYDNYDTARGDV